MLKQAFAIAVTNIRSIPQRMGSSLVVILGTAGVVSVLLAVLGMATSLSQTVLATGRTDRAIVLSGSTDAEAASMIPANAFTIIAHAPGVARTSWGKPAATLDTLASATFAKSSGERALLNIRGMSLEGFAVRPEIRLVEGRLYKAGLHEVIVGKPMQSQFLGLQVGEKIKLRGTEWTIVGAYTSRNALESAFLTDVDTLLSAYQRAEGNSVTVLLRSPAQLAAFQTALAGHPMLGLQVFQEREFYERQARTLSTNLFIVTYLVGGIMALGAVFAALNTMYSAVSVRTREFATLRALGFGRRGVVLSILIESLLLALLGAALGTAIVWLLLGGAAIHSGDVASSLVFTIRMTPGLLAAAASLGCGIGLLGGLLPALRAARMQVAPALRAL